MLERLGGPDDIEKAFVAFAEGRFLKGEDGRPVFVVGFRGKCVRLDDATGARLRARWRPIVGIALGAWMAWPFASVLDPGWALVLLLPMGLSLLLGPRLLTAGMATRRIEAKELGRMRARTGAAVDQGAVVRVINTLCSVAFCILLTFVMLEQSKASLPPWHYAIGGLVFAANVICLVMMLADLLVDGVSPTSGKAARSEAETR